MLKKENLQDVYTLSLMQEGILFHALYDKDSAAYFQQMSYEVLGQLELSLTFNTGQYQLQTMESLSDNYVVQLKEVVSHCTSKTGGEITPSDLTYQGLSSDDLDKIFDN
jgi:non-ribosomal peptide synthase protein (TIGR01720 family)